jgi:hypothetical protein
METMAPEQQAEAAPTAEASEPEYLSHLADGSETAVLQRISDLEGEIQRLKDSLIESRKSKQILTLSGTELRNELLRFLNDAIGLPARAREDVPGRRSGDADGFWLVAEALGEEWCFGMIVDSANGNVSRAQVAKAMLNREEAGKGDDFPALLVVNTFRDRTTMEDRDTPVPEEVIKRAAEDNILIVRTLDLVRLRQKEQSGFAGVPEFQAKVREGGGGWYEVNTSLASRYRKE